MTVSTYLESMWLPHIKTRVRDRTYDTYASQVDAYIVAQIGSVRLDKLAAYRLDRWMGELAVMKSKYKHDGKERVLSAQTRLHAYRTLHSALVQAVKWSLLAYNPLDAVDPPKVSQSDPDTLTSTEVNAYLDAFVGHELEPFILVALGAGLRRSELAALMWSDIDFSAGTVTVREGLHQRKGKVYPEDPKTTRSARSVSLPPWALERLRVLRRVGPLVSRDGLPMRPNTITYAYGAHVRSRKHSPKLRYVPLKNLRHSSAMLALEMSGGDLVTVSRRLGHSTVTTTDRFYVKGTREADDNVAQMMDGIRGQREPSAKVSQQK
jgi:integrase